jgi:hypothetical protein
MRCPHCGSSKYGKHKTLLSGTDQFRCKAKECRQFFTIDAKCHQVGPGAKNRKLSVQHPLDPDLPVEEIVQIRKRQFAKLAQAEESRKIIPVKVPMSGPIGILHYGDPHVDDDGTDIAALERHAILVRDTEGLFAGNVGDTTNNWVGRLARLYGEQGTTARMAWKLAEWWINLQKDKWLYMIGGNHDLWSGAGDPLNWITRQIGALYQSSEARIGLHLPGLQRQIVVNVRHDFNGHSMWNPAHGVGRAIQQGMWDEIAICGHRHVSGYMILKSPTDGRVCHAIQVASYKLFDRYAREKGFRDQNVSPAVLTIINPLAATEAGLITVFWDIDEGVRYLKWLRAKR